jgi:hypothetical protein
MELTGGLMVWEALGGVMKMQKRFGIAIVTALLTSPLAAQGRRIPDGAERGAAEGSAATGRRCGRGRGWRHRKRNQRFACHDYVMREHRSSYRRAAGGNDPAAAAPLSR